MINSRKQDLDEVEKLLVDALEITFMTGKGNNHLVPLIFPPDTVKAIKILTDETVRSQVEVAPHNRYVFPSLGNSENHVSGWHAVHKMSDVIKEQLENVKALTATSNRHRVSTLFAMLDLPRQDREWFYKHMGHSEAINQCRYQAPPAIMELTKVAKHLVDMDGKYSLFKRFSFSFFNLNLIHIYYNLTLLLTLILGGLDSKECSSSQKMTDDDPCCSKQGIVLNS